MMLIDRTFTGHRFLSTIALALLSSITLVAGAALTSRELLVSMAENAKRMTKYEWKQRITVVRKGTPTEPTIVQVKFDSNGQMQRTTISAPPQKDMRGIRGRIAAGVKEDVKGVMELAASYNKPRQIVDAVKKGQISAGSGNLTQVVAQDIVEQGDRMTMLVDPATRHATHITFLTKYEGSPVTIEQDYKPVAGGPNVMQNMKVTIPQKDIVVNIQAYDFKPAS